MKKILFILLTLLMIVSIVGCDTKQEEIIKADEPVQQEETVVEQQEETVKEEVKVEELKEVKNIFQDITNMSFWVVFYDQYGNELQREALKYGTVPEYKLWLPEGFEKWDKPLKAIEGNTYYHAICHEVNNSSGGSPGSNHNPIKNEYGFYYNVKYYGADYFGDMSSTVTVEIIFTDIESVLYPGSKYAIVKIPSFITRGVFLYSVDNSNHVITMNTGSIYSPLKFIIHENTIDLNIEMSSWNLTMNIIDQNIDKIEKIDSNFFHYGSTIYVYDLNSSATFLDVPGGFSSVGDNFLFGNTSVDEVMLPPSIKNIGRSAFESCTGLTTILLRSGLQTIGESAFYNSGLLQINIPPSVNTIQDSAFGNCTSLMDVDFLSNSNISNIGNQTFAWCENIQEIVLPDHLIMLGDDAFYHCGDLNTITIPATIESIGDTCFGGCTSLSIINYNGTKTQWSNVAKGDGWNSGIPATVVHCSNGDIDIE